MLMLNRHASDAALTKDVRARLFNLCLTLAAFFLSMAGQLGERKACVASDESTLVVPKPPQEAGDLNRGWQGQTA
jgi:hypothetical protein